jgi:hypothetical protein
LGKYGLFTTPAERAYQPTPLMKNLSKLLARRLWDLANQYDFDSVLEMLGKIKQ